MGDFQYTYQSAAAGQFIVAESSRGLYVLHYFIQSVEFSAVTSSLGKPNSCQAVKLRELLSNMQSVAPGCPSKRLGRSTARLSLGSCSARARGRGARRGVVAVFRGQAEQMLRWATC